MDPFAFYNAPTPESALSSDLPTRAEDERDELDLLSGSPDVPTAARHNLRVRVPPASISAPLGSRRKRGLSLSTAENQSAAPRGNAAKKPRVAARATKQAAKQGRTEEKQVKKEEKRAITIVINANRANIEATRRRWLHAHQHLFDPLLPPSSTFFANVSQELDAAGSDADFVPFKELDEQPKLIETATLKDYQLHGVSWLVYMHKNGMNCILGDEMGLGKTLQTLSLFAYIRQHAKGTIEPHLVVCPLSVLASWEAECARWFPSARAVRLQGAASERARFKNTPGALDGVDILLTTYETFVAEASWFKSRRWTYCVLDEGHRIKNAETNLASTLQGIGALHRLILTGTPVHNNLLELWSLLHWLHPMLFTPASERAFKDAFDLTRGAYSLPFLNSAKALLEVMMLRRTKSSVTLDVPPREEMTVFVPLSDAQRFWTYRLLTRMDGADLAGVFTASEDQEPKAEAEEGSLTSEPSAASTSTTTTDDGRTQVRELMRQQARVQTATGQQHQWKRLMNLLMQLRKVCDHPYMLPDAEPEPYSIGEHIVASSSKLVAIDKILGDILPKGERVLIFSQWTSMLDLLEDFMALRNYRYARLDGSTPRPRRTLNIRMFQQEKSPYQVFLISTKAGGLGINLTKASNVIMCDSDWNPQNDLQAIARAHRIGQTKICKVYRLICRGSVEDQMLDRLRRKLYLSLKVMGSSDNPSSDDKAAQLGKSDLMDILRKGSSALASEDASSVSGAVDFERFLAAPLADLLAASRAKDVARDARARADAGEPMGITVEADGRDEEQLRRDAEAEEAVLLRGVAQVQSRLFEGRLVTQAKAPQGPRWPGDKRVVREIADEWHTLQKRARENRIVVVDGMEFIAPQAVSPPPTPQVKKKKKQWIHEDWCIHCRDGGELFCCTHCPRVFHSDCRGLSDLQLRRMPVCAQHSCAVCDANTSEAGGMLFRCQTCAQAFCEDCLPDGELDAIGDTLPEFSLLGFPESASYYYIRCHSCHAHWEENPADRAAWEAEMKTVETKLAALMA